MSTIQFDFIWILTNVAAIRLLLIWALLLSHIRLQCLQTTTKLFNFLLDIQVIRKGSICRCIKLKNCWKLVHHLYYIWLNGLLPLHEHKNITHSKGPKLPLVVGLACWVVTLAAIVDADRCLPLSYTGGLSPKTALMTWIKPIRSEESCFD